MSQHDFTIANQGFPGFRSDLNNALQALATQSSGSSAPSPTFAYQIWVDTSTTPAVMKLRNGDNDAWISLGNIDTSTDTFSLVTSAALTGTSTASTPSASDDSTKIATTAFVRDIIPSGVIVMWSGTIANIPAGWFLCNGSNGTPDLRNRFVIAANADDSGAAKTSITGSATQTGGSKDSITVTHTHTATSTDSGHSHIIQVSNLSGASVDDRLGGSGADYGIQNVNDSGTTTKSGTANITTTIDSAGSSGTNANLPPYYALAYIMKA